jgi:hypothetical protein
MLNAFLIRHRMAASVFNFVSENGIFPIEIRNP